MKTCTKTLLAAVIGSAALVGSANADIILADDFAGVVKSGASATIVAWDTEDGIDAVETLTATDDGDTASGYFGNIANALDVDDKTWNAPGDGWNVSFAAVLDAGTTSIDLESFDLTAFSAGGNGTYRTNTDTTKQWTLTITGDDGYGSQSASVLATYIQLNNTSGNTASSIDLSGLGDLVQGENYTFTLGVRASSGDLTYMTLEDISLSGTVVPEPGSLALLGLGGLMMIKRRRRG